MLFLKLWLGLSLILAGLGTAAVFLFVCAVAFAQWEVQPFITLFESLNWTGFRAGALISVIVGALFATSIWDEY